MENFTFNNKIEKEKHSLSFSNFEDVLQYVRDKHESLSDKSFKFENINLGFFDYDSMTNLSLEMNKMGIEEIVFNNCEGNLKYMQDNMNNTAKLERISFEDCNMDTIRVVNQNSQDNIYVDFANTDIKELRIVDSYHEGEFCNMFNTKLGSFGIKI